MGIGSVYSINLAGEKRSRPFEVNRGTSFLLFLIASALFFSFVLLSVEPSILVDRVVHCSNDEYLCDCGSYCDNSNLLSAEINNTIDGCKDGVRVAKGLGGVYDYSEFVYGVRISNANLSVDNYFNSNDYVIVDAQILCSMGGDNYYIFYKNSTDNGVSWRLINTSFCVSNDPILSEIKDVSVTLQLDDAPGDHAIRVFVTYNDALQNYSCGYDNDPQYSDTDDMVFEVLEKSDFNPPVISIIAPNSGTVFESSNDDNIIGIIANITDQTGVDESFVNVSYTDNASLNTASEKVYFEKVGELYYANATIPPSFIGLVNMTFYANDTVYVNSNSFIPNHVNNNISLIVYFTDNFIINITSPEMLSVKNTILQTINVTVSEDSDIKNYTLKTLDINGGITDLQTAQITIIDENTTIYSLNQTFAEGENTFSVCIKNATTNESFDCSSLTFTVDLTPPRINYNLSLQYLNNETVAFYVNLTDLLSIVENWSIRIIDANSTVFYESENTINNKENLILVSVNLTNTSLYALVIDAFDAARNQNSSMANFTVIDLKSPDILITHSPNDSESLDPNNTVSLSINVSDEGLIQNATILVSFDNDTLYYQALTVKSEYTSGNKHVHHYEFNFTPDEEGLYYIEVSAIDDASNEKTVDTNFSAYYETKYNSSFEYNSSTSCMGQTDVVNYYRLENTGDIPINLSINSDNLLETTLSEYLIQLSPGEERTINVSVESDQYVNEYEIYITTSCEIAGCVNENSEEQNATDSFVLYVTNDNAFLIIEESIGSIFYDEATDNYTLTLKNIGKSNASNISLMILSNTTLLNITNSALNISNLSGLDGQNYRYHNFSISVLTVDADTKALLTFGITYNNSEDIVIRNVAKTVTIKPTPVIIREIITGGTSSSRTSSGGGGVVIIANHSAVNSSQISSAIELQNVAKTEGISDNASNQETGLTLEISDEINGDANEKESFLDHPSGIADTASGLQDEKSKTETGGLLQKGNAFNGKDITEYIVSYESFMAKLKSIGGYKTLLFFIFGCFFSFCLSMYLIHKSSQGPL